MDQKDGLKRVEAEHSNKAQVEATLAWSKSSH